MIAKHFVSQGKHVIILAPTHVASNNLGGVTIHSFAGANYFTQTVGRGGTLTARLGKADCVLVDDCFMIGEFLWYCLGVMQQIRPGLGFYLFGDPAQLGPVEPRNLVGYDYMEHSTLKMLAGLNRFELTVSKRTSDCKLPAVNNRLRDETKWADLQQFFPTTSQPAKLNIAMTNGMVFHINSMCMQQYKPSDAVFVLADSSDSRTQDTWLFPGMPLISCKTVLEDKEQLAELRKKTYNNMMKQLRDRVGQQICEAYTVESVEADTSTVKYDRTGKAATWPTTEFHSLYRPGYCSTVHKVQGKTLTEDYVIWEHQHMDRRSRYTAVSRAQHSSQISQGTDPPGVWNSYREHVCKNIDAMAAQCRPADKESGNMISDLNRENSWKLLMIQGECCHACGGQMKVKDFQKRDPLLMTPDRIDNAMGGGPGHTIGNIRFAHLKCNCDRLWHEDK